MPRAKGEPLPCRMREKTVWSGEYQGVGFEINRWPGYEYESIQQNNWNWSFYLYLWLDRIPEDCESYWLPPRKDERGRVHYDYYAHPILYGIEWHGGMTWYSKESGHDGARRVVKAGCDFQHLWDHERGDYSLDEVLYDVKAAVESFRKMVPGYKYWCQWDGKYHAPEEVERFPDGSYKCGCSAKAALSQAGPR